MMNPLTRSLKSKFYLLLIAIISLCASGFLGISYWYFKESEKVVHSNNLAIERLSDSFLENLTSLHSFLSSGLIYDLSEMSTNRLTLQGENLIDSGLVTEIAFFTADAICFFVANQETVAARRSLTESEATKLHFSLLREQKISESEMNSLAALATHGQLKQVVERDSTNADTLTLVARFGRDKEVIGYTTTTFSIKKIEDIKKGLLEENQLARRRALLSAFGFSGGFLLLFFCAGFFILRSFSRALIKPVLHLHQVTLALQGGDLGARANETAQDEVGLLGKHLNHMAASVQANLQRMQRIVVISQEIAGTSTPELAIKIVISEFEKAVNFAFGTQKNLEKPHVSFAWSPEYASRLSEGFKQHCGLTSTLQSGMASDREDLFIKTLRHGDETLGIFTFENLSIELLQATDLSFMDSLLSTLAVHLEALRTRDEAFHAQTNMMRVQLEKLGHVAVYLGDRLATPMNIITLACEELEESQTSQKGNFETAELIRKINVALASITSELQKLDQYKRYSSNAQVNVELDENLKE